MSRVALILALGLVVPCVAGAVDHGRFGLAGGFVVPTRVTVDGEAVVAEPGPLLLLSFDRPVSPDLALEVGGFLHVGSITAGRRDEQVNFFEAGGAVHWVTPVLDGGELRLGGGVGFRRLFADATRYDAIGGLALDASAELSRSVAPGLVGQVEVGVLSQPFGRNDGHDVVWLPAPYLALGVQF